ncbi:MAG: hypothetical protein GTO63_30010 [Anaerolineae bacterium]|nr:hypothetical protein [Anaerolineae bacterium]NIQ81840.1 hypothetical protein [Anaerolineae bacterium]
MKTVEEALKGTDIELEDEIFHRRRLMGMMVGPLHTSILAGEIDQLLQERQKRRAQLSKIGELARRIREAVEGAKVGDITEEECLAQLQQINRERELLKETI